MHFLYGFCFEIIIFMNLLYLPSNINIFLPSLKHTSNLTFFFILIINRFFLTDFLDFPEKYPKFSSVLAINTILYAYSITCLLWLHIVHLVSIPLFLLLLLILYWNNNFMVDNGSSYLKFFRIIILCDVRALIVTSFMPMPFSALNIFPLIKINKDDIFSINIWSITNIFLQNLHWYWPILLSVTSLNLLFIAFYDFIDSYHQK